MFNHDDEYIEAVPDVYPVKILSAVNSSAGNVVYRARIMRMTQPDIEGAAIVYVDTGLDILVGNLTTTRIPTDGTKILIAFPVEDKYMCEYNG